jgi:selenocysteine lyase/cysteine desulfurase
VDARAFRQAMLDRRGVVVKMAEKRWFNGFRLSPHLFNAEADIDRALAAIRDELA